MAQIVYGEKLPPEFIKNLKAEAGAERLRLQAEAKAAREQVLREREEAVQRRMATKRGS